jgi:hypothetical protein
MARLAITFISLPKGRHLVHGRAWYRNLGVVPKPLPERGVMASSNSPWRSRKSGLLAEAFVAAREGLVDQHSTRRESAGNCREQRGQTSKRTCRDCTNAWRRH